MWQYTWVAAATTTATTADKCVPSSALLTSTVIALNLPVIPQLPFVAPKLA